MPRLRSNPFLFTSLLVAALALFSASTLLAQPMSNPEAKPPRTMTWVLTNGTVIAPEQIKTDGNLTTGYVVEATAAAQGRARVLAGKFTIKCTIENKGGGQFLLRGAWDITREGAPQTTRRTPDSIKGTLVANLDFNPAASINQAAGAGPINGNVLVNPKRRHAGKEVKAKGTFKGDEKFNGTIFLSRN
ncbi:MAG: hypothetical protein FJ121_00110 [Deltaproteobacteria bacterium]|nr:hypothetical protein [Deltaproteobacteria bacterium]